jgi:hypothetical protein
MRETPEKPEKHFLGRRDRFELPKTEAKPVITPVGIS